MSAPPPKVRNLRTQSLTRRETFWQITLPVGLALVAAVTLMMLVTMPGAAGRRSAFADASLIFMIVPAALWGVVLLALIVGLSVGLWYALRELPPLFKQAQDLMARVAQQTKAAAGQMTGALASGRNLLGMVRGVAADIRSRLPFGR